MPLLSLLVGLVCGLVVWVVMDPLQSRALRDIFAGELQIQLEHRARDSLVRFNQYMGSYESSAHLLASHRGLVSYLEPRFWFPDASAPLPSYSDHEPDWLPEESIWNVLMRPSHIVFFDMEDRAREVYSLRGVPLPAEFLDRVGLYLSESQLHIYLTALDEKPFVLVSEPVEDNGGVRIGTLMLLVPVDDGFLVASQQGVFADGTVVAVVDADEHRILASSDEESLPSGARLDQAPSRYIVTAQSFFEYEGSDLNMQFATLVPRKGFELTTQRILSLERRQRTIGAVVFIAVFTLVMFVVSARLNFVLRRLSRFSRRALGMDRPPLRGRNQLMLLEDSVAQFTRLVLAARESMRSQYESEMRETQALKSAIMDTARDCIVTIEESGEIVDFNPTAEKTFGLDRSSAMGSQLPKLLLAKSAREPFRALLDRCRRSPMAESADNAVELLALRADGTEFPVELAVVPIELQSRPVCAVYLYDISKRQKAEQEIQNLARFASESPSPVLRVNERGVILYANSASDPLLEYWGVGRGQTLPLFWRERIKQTMEQNQQIEHEINSDDRIYSLLLAPVLDLGYVNIYGRDITEVRQAERQARQHQAELVHVCRLSTMGEMSTGLAHELNQPLAAILNFARGGMRRLQAGKGKGDSMIPALEQIASQAERAGEIIRRLRNLVAKQPPVRTPVDVNDLVREVCSFVEYESRRLGIEIDLRLSSKPLPVRADLVQIEQVLLNLIRNAMDALQDIPLERRSLVIRTASAGLDAVQISVRDTGLGIRPEDTRSLFDPFFTTKPSGMGMGLPISKTIIEEHKGSISARSTPGEGTEFTVVLPNSPFPAAIEELSGTG